MAPASASSSPRRPAVGPVHTLIFVDVDGVLNVGIADPGKSAIELSDQNLAQADRYLGSLARLPASARSCVERIQAVRAREVEGEDGAYAQLASAADSSLSDVLVGRLAKLILAAGDCCTVVLSSTWRLPRHTQRARVLEEAVGRHLGRPFEFDDRTSQFEDRSTEGRLMSCGDFAEQFCRRHSGSLSTLRMLVLEDFHVNSLGSWGVEGRPVRGPNDVERYLCSRVPDSLRAQAKLVHTFDEFRTESGLHVKVGCGLTRQHFAAALTFLDSVDAELEFASEASAGTASTGTASTTASLQEQKEARQDVGRRARKAWSMLSWHFMARY